MSIVISGCASFPVPDAETDLKCISKSEQKNFRQVVLEIKKQSDFEDPSNTWINYANYISYTKNALIDFGCFEDVTISDSTTNSKENGKVYFVVDKVIPQREGFTASVPFLTLITLGIIPSWATINTDVRVVEYKEGIGEVELVKVHHDRTQILSIFLTPVGLYRMIMAPSGLNANEMAQVETNKYLFGEAIKELTKKIRIC